MNGKFDSLFRESNFSYGELDFLNKELDSLYGESDSLWEEFDFSYREYDSLYREFCVRAANQLDLRNIFPESVRFCGFYRGKHQLWSDFMAFRTWFPKSLQAQAAFFLSFTIMFRERAASMGFSVEDIEKLEADTAVMQYLAQIDVLFGKSQKSFTAFKKQLTKGRSGNQSAYPNFELPSAPPIVPDGIFERLFKLADRICAADNYSPSVGAAFNILPKKKEALRAEDLRLSLKIKQLAQAQVEIRYVRGKTSGVNLYLQRAGSDEWIDLGRFFHSPIIIKIPLLVADQPEQFYLRGRYLIGNEAVGEYSAITPLILRP